MYSLIRENISIKYVISTCTSEKKRVGMAEFSQKSDLVLAELLQTMLHLNRHINSHGKSAHSDQQAHQQKLMRTFAFHCPRSDYPGRTTRVQGARTPADHTQHENNLSKRKVKSNSNGSNIFGIITKTCLFKYTENFSTKK